MGRSRGPRTSVVGHVADIGRGWADDGNGSITALDEVTAKEFQT